MDAITLELTTNATGPRPGTVEPLFDDDRAIAEHLAGAEAAAKYAEEFKSAYEADRAQERYDNLMARYRARRQEWEG